jgi:hypothetical protein
MATTPPSAGSPNDPSGQGAAPAAGGTAASGTTAADTPVNLQVLAALAMRTLVAGTRHVLVPLANLYAHPIVAQDTGDQAPPANALTPFEKASLSRAAQKLVVEAGGLLTANFRPVPEGTTYEQPVADKNGLYGEPSLAAVVSAVAGIRAAQAARQAKRDAGTTDAQAALRPVTLQALRALRRG